MTHPTVPNPVLLRRLALARAILALIDTADDSDAVSAIVNGDRAAMKLGGLTETQHLDYNDTLVAKPFSPAVAAQCISKIIADNHGGGSMVAVATASSIDLARTIKLIDREVSQISAKSDPRDVISRVGNIKQLVSGVALLLEPASARTPYRHGPADQSWIAAE